MCMWILDHCASEMCTILKEKEKLREKWSFSNPVQAKPISSIIPPPLTVTCTTLLSSYNVMLIMISLNHYSLNHRLLYCWTFLFFFFCCWKVCLSTIFITLIGLWLRIFFFFFVFFDTKWRHRDAVNLTIDVNLTHPHFNHKLNRPIAHTQTSNRRDVIGFLFDYRVKMWIMDRKADNKLNWMLLLVVSLSLNWILISKIKKIVLKRKHEIQWEILYFFYGKRVWIVDFVSISLTQTCFETVEETRPVRIRQKQIIIKKTIIILTEKHSFFPWTWRYVWIQCNRTIFCSSTRFKLNLFFFFGMVVCLFSSFLSLAMNLSLWKN